MYVLSYFMLLTQSCWLRRIVGHVVCFRLGADRHPSAHCLLLRQGIVLFSLHQFHSHSYGYCGALSLRRHSPFESLAPVVSSPPHSKMAHRAHRRYLGSHHPGFQHSLPSHLHVARCQHRPHSSGQASSRLSLPFHRHALSVMEETGAVKQV